MGRSLPLSLGIVGTDISRLTMGALGAEKGVVGGEQRTRAVERFEDFVFGEISCCWEISCSGGIRCCYVSWITSVLALLIHWR